MELAEVKEAVNTAICNLFEADSYLLENDVNERSITHKLAVHFEDKFPNFDVDCGCIRNRQMPKKVSRMVKRIYSDNTDGKTVYPDIIVHQRGTNKNNMLIIEVKKFSVNESGWVSDREKIQAFRVDDEYSYKFGCFIVFCVGENHSDRPKIDWFPED